MSIEYTPLTQAEAERITAVAQAATKHIAAAEDAMKTVSFELASAARVAAHDPVFADIMATIVQAGTELSDRLVALLAAIRKDGAGTTLWEPPMSVAEAARLVVSRLSRGDRAYAASPARGKSRGFAALHDLCDANMLIPGSEEFGGTDAQTFWMNSVMAAVTRLLLVEQPTTATTKKT